MKKVLFVIMFCVVSTSIGVSSVLIHYNNSEHVKKQRYYDLCLERVWRFTQPSEIVLYVLNQSIADGVDPVDMIAILYVENPIENPYAVNKNYKKVWDKKLKKLVVATEYNKKKHKYVPIVDSTDNGLFQLNSKHIEEFIYRYWTPYETEVFNVNNYKHNTRIAVRLYKSLYKNYQNDLIAVCAYNGGSGNVNRNTIPFKTLNEYVPKFQQHKAIMIKE